MTTKIDGKKIARDIRSRVAEEVAAVIDELAADPAVSGILLQLPLPEGLDSAALIDRIPVGKDVDGLTTASAGLLARGEFGLRPCTPSGVVELLDAEGVTIEGAHAVVVGRSELVGRPMAQLLLQRDATVTIAHRYTTDLAAVTRPADIVVVATGVPGLVGDVRASEVDGVAGRFTPVPGGVGPMTIALLMVNTLRAAAWAKHSA
ncbi:bifunctional 5,10-methylenetetrahydrofolate dehydrogenase/5,10-methenyltetrahydrofolate cyclohydrolase [Streptomyces mirabilis]|uniref:bifunctional 5,10-methylenetetrahydrofolate dehydrogenase/5,10-methenyltetrahydrofolate cyclohydrolase n=1 Tax=Streptomyces mirabilis TaxID=68239 RepID=UPI0033A19169